MHRHHTIFLLSFLLACMTMTACSRRAPQPAQPPVPLEQPAAGLEAQPAPVPAPAPAPEARPEQAAQQEEPPCLECDAVSPAKDRAGCFKLQPGAKSKNAKGKTVTGRCQPQCIPYARCRSGFMTCRLGDTSPVQWFECARKSKATSAVPKAGSLMVIGVDKRHNMSTGHLGYVEEACPNADGTWTLRFSHTNYDRKCHLDLDAKVLFNPKTMRAAFLSGPWKTWARDLKILGFILR